MCIANNTLEMLTKSKVHGPTHSINTIHRIQLKNPMPQSNQIYETLFAIPTLPRSYFVSCVVVPRTLGAWNE